jgi:hypothetical protein
MVCLKDSIIQFTFRCFVFRRLLILFSLTILFFTFDCFSQVKTKEGLTISLFTTTDEEILLTKDIFTYGLSGITGQRMFDRIVIKGTESSYFDTGLIVNIFKLSDEGKKKELIMKKDLNTIIFHYDKNNTYTLPIYPWIEEDGKYQIVVMSGNRNLINFTYTIFTM